MLDQNNSEITPKTTIQTRSGSYFDFLDPTFGADVIDTVAHALSNLCRFTGHARAFYSVAEHSVHASHIVPPEHAMAALMHDAAEAFIGDVAKPLKNILPDFAVIEERVERALFAHLDLPYPMHPEIKKADKAMLAIEQIQVMGSSDKWYHCEGAELVDTIHVAFWTPEQARDMFLERYHTLKTAA